MENIYAKILSDAEKAIAKYGHAKGDFGDQNTGFCVLGAIRYASRRASCGYDTMTHTSDMVKHCLPEPIEGLATFNDAPHTHAKEIRELLLCTASLAMDGT